MPERYLTVWTGGQFPYAAVLSLASMMAADPCATVELHHLGERPDRPELRLLAATGRFETHTIDVARLFDTTTLDLFERVPREAHAARSNLVRIALLHTRGGVYLDLDTFVLRPLARLAPGAFVGRERVWRLDRYRIERGLKVRHWPATAAWSALWAIKRADSMVTGGRLRVAGATHRIDRCLHSEQLNNAVIGAPAQSALTEALLRNAALRSPHVRYALGPALLDDTLADHPHVATVLHTELFYAVPPGESHRIFHDRTLQLPDQAAVVHYVHSNHADLIAGLGPEDPRYERPELFWRLANTAQQSLRTFRPATAAVQQ